MFKRERTGQGPELERIVALERQVLELEKRVKEIDVEWSMWFDKFRRLLATISKRAQRAEEAPERHDQPEENPLARRLMGL